MSAKYTTRGPDASSGPFAFSYFCLPSEADHSKRVPSEADQRERAKGKGSGTKYFSLCVQVFLVLSSFHVFL